MALAYDLTYAKPFKTHSKRDFVKVKIPKGHTNKAWPGHKGKRSLITYSKRVHFDLTNRNTAKKN